MVSAPQAAAREQSVDVGGVPLLVTEFGPRDGPPVVLLHGIGSRGSSWWPVIDPLAERFHLYQLDLRGHGGSAKPECGYAIEDYVADLQAVLDALGLAEPRIMGHSLGALVALIWAGEHPSRAAALVLEDPPLRTEPGILEAFDGWQQLAALTPEAAAAWYRQQYPGWSDEDCRRRGEAITATAPGVFAELRAQSAAALTNGETDRGHLLADVQSPALLLRGDPSLGSMVTPEDAARFAQLLPHGEVILIPGAGHSLHRDATAAFLEVVVPFLAGDGVLG